MCVSVCVSVGMRKHRVQQLEDENGEMKMNVCRLKSQTEKLDQVSVTNNEDKLVVSNSLWFAVLAVVPTNDTLLGAGTFQHQDLKDEATNTISALTPAVCFVCFFFTSAGEAEDDRQAGGHQSETER